jgi:flagellar protein FlaI
MNTEGKTKEILDKYTLEYETGKINVIIHRDKPVPVYAISLVEISDNVRKVLNRIREHVTSEISFDIVNLSTEERMNIEKQFKAKIHGLMKKTFPEIDKESFAKLLNHMIVTSLGLGEIEYLLKDPDLEEIVVNGANQPVWVYHKKHGWLKTNIIFETEDTIRHFSTMIGKGVNRDITTLNPLLDAVLRTGDRVNATLQPITSKGNTITIRKFAEKPWTITDFLGNNTIDYLSAAVVWQAIEYEQSMIVTGGTGSGKTSVLNVLSNFFPPNHRILSIEDTRELKLSDTLHWVPMLTRLPNPEGKGEVSMLDLLVNTLRMRPDRIVVGEIRREREIEVLFEAIRTGHSGYATFHANTVQEAVSRLTNAPINLPPISLADVGLMIVQHRDRRTGRRTTFQIAEFDEKGIPNVLYQRNFQKDRMEKAAESKVLLKRIGMFSAMTPEMLEDDLNEKMKVLKWLVKSKIDTVNKIGIAISDYYTDRKNLLSRIK